MRVLRCGRDALLVEVASLEEVSAVRAEVVRAELDGVVEVVPAARTVLVAARPGSAALDEVRSLLSGLDLSRAAAADPHDGGPDVTLPVVYDGPDLQLVASTAGLPAGEVVRLHTAASYTVAFCGFAPGFGYLTGLPPELQQPRLESPRASVPAGAVGIAGEFTGVYPRSSPGGWRLLGRTPTTLFDASRTPAALLTPGTRVRFEAA